MESQCGVLNSEMEKHERKEQRVWMHILYKYYTQVIKSHVWFSCSAIRDTLWVWTDGELEMFRCCFRHLRFLSGSMCSMNKEK